MSTAASLDAADPLARFRGLFTGAESDLVYFDGNSLGRPLASVAPAMAEFVEHAWGGRLIRGWDEEWFDLPTTLGDRIGRTVLGAAPGQTVVADSTSVLLYKLLRAAVAARPGRTEIVLDDDNFPTDRYLAASVAAECGMTLRWIEVDRSAGVDADQLRAVVDERTAVVLLSHVAYRSAWLADAAELTRIAHDAGALMLLDLCHSVGSVELALDEWGVDLAVGCTYKYLNGGPGSPAFGYVAQRLISQVEQPIQGWWAEYDPFEMGPRFRPADGIRRMLSGTAPVISMLPLTLMLPVIEEATMAAVREKSVALTRYAIELSDELLAPLGAVLASPRADARRGGHITVNHPAMKQVNAELWERDVIGDYREPHGLRLGLSPLSTSFAEVERGMQMVRERLAAAPH